MIEPPAPLSRGATVVLATLAALSAAAGLLVLAVMAIRVAYLYQLENCETVVLELVDRIVAWKAVYAEPSVEYIATLYPPVFLYAGAWITKLFGASFLPLRLLSLFAVCGTCLIIAREAWIRSGRLSVGVIAAGLYLVSYQRSGFFMDLARIDALWVFFLLSSFTLLRNIGSSPGFALFLAAWLLALFTKQTTLFFVPACLVSILTFEQRGGWVRALVFIAIQGVCSMLMHLATSGWFWFYCFTIPGGHPLYLQRFDEFLQNAAAPVFFTMLFGAPLLLGGDARQVAARLLQPLPLFFVSAASSAILGNLKIGGSWNHFMPLFAFNAIGVAAVCCQWMNKTPASNPLGRKWRIGLAAVLLALQGACFWHDPLSALPSQAQLDGDQRLENAMMNAGGPVYCSAPYYYMMIRNNRHPEYLNPAALQDIQWAGLRSIADPLARKLDMLMDSGHFRTLVMHSYEAQRLPEKVRKWYAFETNVLVPRFVDQRICVLS